MIDIKFLRENPDAVRASQHARGEADTIVDEVLAADEARRTAIAAFEARRAEQKAASKQLGPVMGQLTKARKSGGDAAQITDRETQAEALKAQGAQMSDEVKALDAQAGAAQENLDTLVRRIGNIIEPGVPSGGEDNYVVIDTVGETQIGRAHV